MLYVPIKIYPNRRSLRGCIVRAAAWLGLAMAGFQFIDNHSLKLMAYCLSMAGFGVTMLSAIAVLTRQPMIKVLDDRFSVYTPFGPAMMRFGEVLAFSKGRVPFLRAVRVKVNKSARARFPSGVGRVLYVLTHFDFTNSVTIPGFMLGAEPESVMQMLEKRRLAAVRPEAVRDYDPQRLAEAG